MAVFYQSSIRYSDSNVFGLVCIFKEERLNLCIFLNMCARMNFDKNKYHLHSYLYRVRVVGYFMNEWFIVIHVKVYWMVVYVQYKLYAIVIRYYTQSSYRNLFVVLVRTICTYWHVFFKQKTSYTKVFIIKLNPFYNNSWFR